MGVLLSTQGLTKIFGGLTAVSDLSISIEDGQIIGLIGPNGAGKTTAFNMITGVYKPTSGVIKYGDTPIQGMKSHKITRLGIARTFQNIRLFKEMTVLENVLVARHSRMGTNLVEAVLHLPSYRQKEKEAVDMARSLLERVNLLDLANENSTNLPYGKQRRLEIARAFGHQPEITVAGRTRRGDESPGVPGSDGLYS